MCQLSESVAVLQGRKVIAGFSSEANRKMMILFAEHLLKYHSIKTIKAGGSSLGMVLFCYQLLRFTEMFQ